MDGFGDNFVESAAPAAPAAAPAAEVDPAADFLAREQDQLAGLEDDVTPAAPAAPVVEAEAPAAVPAAEEGQSSSDLFGEAPVSGAMDLESFEMLGGDISTPANLDGGSDEKVDAPAPILAAELQSDSEPKEDLWGSTQPSSTLGEEAGESQPEGEASLLSQTLGDVGDVSQSPFAPVESQPSSQVTGEDDWFGTAAEGTVGEAIDGDMMGEVLSAPVVAQPNYEAFEELKGESIPASTPAPPVFKVEAEKIRIWREEQKKVLEEKDEAEEKAKLELRERGRKELEDWYKQHEEQVAKTRQANRTAEKELVADIGKIEPGTEWERIAKLCDFNPKTAKSTRDISRMRSIILQVKQNPPVKA
ncbi:clathrin light chain isoform X2 [Oratosquilla oratoria]|uniref:clathrin light chain isoform X2 n=1 Tax=Oratosquilla oratoria TaxID=337810 RepID=UPI003F76C3BF